MRKFFALRIAILVTTLLLFSIYFFHNSKTQRTRFVLFSCLHVGETSETELERAANYTRQLDPDYVVSTGDFLAQEELREPMYNDTFMERYLEFLIDIGIKPEINVFHVSGGVHDGWDNVKCGYYDGVFRKLHKFSDMDMVKIGNLAFFFISEVRGKENYRITKSQLDWLESEVKELSLQGYNIFLVKHTNLYKTTAFTALDGDSDMGAWYGVDTPMNREESDAIKSIVNQYDNVIMIIQGHAHIDATDIDEVGRSAFMNWEQVYGDPNYLNIKAHVLNCAGISTTMHSSQYKSYQNIWFIDFTAGKSYFDLYAHDIDTGEELLHYKISLFKSFETGPLNYEQQWSPCYLDYPKVEYPNSLSDSYKIYVKANNTTFFLTKFKFDKNVTVSGVELVTSGDGFIAKKIAHSDDGINFSQFNSNFPTESHRYWMLRVDIVSDTQIEIYDVRLVLSE